MLVNLLVSNTDEYEYIPCKLKQQSRNDHRSIVADSGMSAAVVLSRACRSMTIVRSKLRLHTFPYSDRSPSIDNVRSSRH